VAFLGNNTIMYTQAFQYDRQHHQYLFKRTVMGIVAVVFIFTGFLLTLLLLVSALALIPIAACKLLWLQRKSLQESETRYSGRHNVINGQYSVLDK